MLAEGSAIGHPEGTRSHVSFLAKGFSPLHTHKPRSKSLAAKSRDRNPEVASPHLCCLLPRRLVGKCRVTSGERLAGPAPDPNPALPQGQPLTCPRQCFLPGVVLPPQGTLRHVWGRRRLSRLGCFRHHVGGARDAAPPPPTVPGTESVTPPSVQFSYKMRYVYLSSCRYFEEPCSGSTWSTCRAPRGR